MRILVTGGAGFIGSSTVRSLAEQGHECVVFDSFEPLLYGRDIKERNLAWASEPGGVSLVEGDVRDAAALQRLFGGASFDAIVHFAAVAGVRPSIEQPALYYDINVTGTARLLEAARRAGASRFVLASSSSVYGANSKTPFAETDPVEAPISPYAASKRAMELLASADQELHGGDMTCLRFFTVYGERQRPEMAIHKFMRMLAGGEAVPMFGAGSTGRDYTYIGDIVAGVQRALERPRGFRIYNLGGDEVVRLNDLIGAIAAVIGVDARIEKLPLQPGDVPLTSADLTRARSELGYEPRTSLEDGLQRMWRWLETES